MLSQRGTELTAFPPPPPQPSVWTYLSKTKRNLRYGLRGPPCREAVQINSLSLRLPQSGVCACPVPQGTWRGSAGLAENGSHTEDSTPRLPHHPCPPGPSSPEQQGQTSLGKCPQPGPNRTPLRPTSKGRELGWEGKGRNGELQRN